MEQTKWWILYLAKIKKSLSLNKLFELSYEKGILINPGNIYDFSNSQNLRISYSYASLEELEKGLRILSELVKRAISMI